MKYMFHTYEILFHYGIGSNKKYKATFKAESVAAAKSKVRAKYRPKGPTNLFIDSVKVKWGK